MRSGGFPIWIVLALAGAALVTAVLFARRPREALLGFFRGLSKAAVCAVIGGVAANLAMTFHNVANRFAEHPDRDLLAMVGISESLSPAILGFSLLAIAWLITAVGIRRLGAAGV